MSDRRCRVVWNCACFLVLLYVGVQVAGVWWFIRAMSVDYSALPPAAVFQRVLRQPVPTGVSDLRVAGHGFCQGHEVWMRFRVTAAALKTLFPETRNPSDWSNRSSWASAYLSAGRLLEPDPSSIKWDEVTRAQKPEQYQFSATEGGQGWSGFFVLDRPDNTVYLYAQVL